MSEPMSVKEMREEILLLDNIGKAIILTYGVEKSNIINPSDPNVQIEMDASEYIKGLLDNIAMRISEINGILIKMN